MAADGRRGHASGMDEDPAATGSRPDPALPHDPDGGARMRFVRRSDGRVIAGVAGGLADYTGLDPMLFRVAFIALAVVGGAGILLYLMAWLVLPEETDSDRLAERIVRRLRSSRFVPLVFIGVAVVVLLEYFSSLGSPVVWAIALIAMGVVMLREEPELQVRPTRTAGAREPEGASESTVERARVVKVRRPRSPLTLYTIGATSMVLAIAAGLTSLEVFELDLAGYLGLGLACIGAGIVVSAWWGGSAWLKLLGVALIPPLLMASIVDVPLSGRTSGHYVVAVQDDPSGSYESLVGHLTFNLERYRFGAEPIVIEATVAAGTVTAMVAPGVTVRLDSSLDLGRMTVFDRVRDGADLRATGTFQESGSSEGELILKVRGGIGSVNVVSAEWIEEEIRYEREQRELEELAERRARRERRRTARAQRRVERRLEDRSSDG
jgi:phage shock protein PspC (stress-responsive transcriptional regulator)